VRGEERRGRDSDTMTAAGSIGEGENIKIDEWGGGCTTSDERKCCS